MTIDQPDDASYDNTSQFYPHSGSLFTNGWLTQLYAYYNSVGILNLPVAWELPSYARIRCYPDACVPRSREKCPAELLQQA
jgi:hypothetical protein